MAKKIKVIIKAPGAKPYGTSISPTPESLRRRFGGDFKIYRFAGDACIICAKKESGLDYNCEHLGRDFYGLMIWGGYSENGLRSFPEEFRVFKTLNPSLFEEFERGAKKTRHAIGDMIGIALCFGLWGWLGYEFIKQIVELL